MGNLSVAYTDLGNPSKSIELLNQALLINKHIHGPEHISLAITMSQLSNAYRHLGDMNKSKSCAKEALQITRHTHGPLYPGIINIINTCVLQLLQVLVLKFCRC